MAKTNQVPGPGARVYRVHVDGETFEVAVEAVGGPALASAPPAPAAVPAPQPMAAAAPQPAAAAPKAADGGAGSLLAPMPGMIIDYTVKVGDAVKAGDVVVILEAMKMENALEATTAGVVKDIYFAKGDAVTKDAVLLTVA